MSKPQTSNLTLPNDLAYQKKLIKYFYQCLLSEGSKIILFSIFALKYNLFPEFIMGLLMLMLLRTNGGGIHCKHYISCLILSFAMLFGSILLANLILLPDLLMKIAVILCIIIGYMNVPITSANRPAASDALIKKCKRNTLLIISGYFILICIISNNLYIHIGFWTIILHIFQLLIAKFLRKGEN